MKNKKLSLNKETVVKLNNNELNNVFGGAILLVEQPLENNIGNDFLLPPSLSVTTTTIILTTQATRGANCDVWSFGETDCPIKAIRDKGRG
ncbi:hypothetical protein FACS189413_16880 [Bacteroidia bacterium]|nr:hypothetical protein FACS189413_16880 [Bacteroidia bacterium]